MNYPVLKKSLCAFLVLLSLNVFADDGKLILRQDETLRYALLVNNYFMRNYPDVGAKSYVNNKERNSRIWTRGVYYEGLMSLYRQYPDDAMLKYAEDWGEFHKWISAEGSGKRHADFQCCGQAYLDLYMLKPEETVRKKHIKTIIDEMMATTIIDDWYWIDAIQMAMPIFAQLGVIEQDERYFQRMYDMYMFSRDKHGGSGKAGGLPLFNEEDGLWYRDYQFDPPYTDLIERDKPCYWSRGNGWVHVALARVLHYAPDTVIYRQQYIDDFVKMSDAIVNCQREDGFWSVSLAAPTNTGDPRSPGPETSGTALFLAGIAYGINSGILDKDVYLPAIIRGWNAMCEMAVGEDGFLGYVQGTGSKPEDGQPVLFNSVPDFEDFGIGCFLLAAAEVYQLGDVEIDGLSVNSPEVGSSPVILRCNNIEGKLEIEVVKNSDSDMVLSVYDINGRTMYRSMETGVNAGGHRFSVSGLPDGFYFVSVNIGNETAGSKIIFRK